MRVRRLERLQRKWDVERKLGRGSMCHLYGRAVLRLHLVGDVGDRLLDSVDRLRRVFELDVFVRPRREKSLLQRREELQRRARESDRV